MPVSFSIVTPSFNQGTYLEETLCSVLGQRYPALEHIVIDGGSTDGSRGILERYAPRLAYWVSEPDRGQVHAINKGLARATGEVVAYLNSDDLYLPGALSAVGEHFARHPECEWVCGDTILFGQDEPTRLVRTVVPSSPGAWLSWAYKAPQPGMFWRRRLLEGGFDERFKYCFDHELYVRLLLEGRRCAHLRLPVAAYRLHGESKTVAENEGFEREFDEIAELYEPRLPWAQRRWSRATRLLRLSCAASGRGDSGVAALLLLRAFLTHPEGVGRRPFWGTLRRLMARLVRAG
jgi:glycosyltransferase involved in cell wall biosynthesis